MLPESDGFSFTPSPDGDSLLTIVSTSGRRDLVTIPIRGGDQRILVENLEIYDSAAWNATGERVLLLSDDLSLGAQRSLTVIDLATGDATLVADDIPDQTYTSAYLMSPGGWLTAVQRSDGLHIVKLP